MPQLPRRRSSVLWRARARLFCAWYASCLNGAPRGRSRVRLRGQSGPAPSTRPATPGTCIRCVRANGLPRWLRTTRMTWRTKTSTVGICVVSPISAQSAARRRTSCSRCSSFRCFARCRAWADALDFAALLLKLPPPRTDSSSSRGRASPCPPPPSASASVPDRVRSSVATAPSAPPPLSRPSLRCPHIAHRMLLPLLRSLHELQTHSGRSIPPPLRLHSGVRTSSMRESIKLS